MFAQQSRFGKADVIVDTPPQILALQILDTVPNSQGYYDVSMQFDVTDDFGLAMVSHRFKDEYGNWSPLIYDLVEVGPPWNNQQTTFNIPGQRKCGQKMDYLVYANDGVNPEVIRIGYAQTPACPPPNPPPRPIERNNNSATR